MPGPVALPEAPRLERTGLGRTLPRRQFFVKPTRVMHTAPSPIPSPRCCPCSLSPQTWNLCRSLPQSPMQSFPNSFTWFSESFQCYVRFDLVSELILYGGWLHLPGCLVILERQFSHLYAVGIWYWGDWHVECSTPTRSKFQIFKDQILVVLEGSSYGLGSFYSTKLLTMYLKIYSN